MALFMMVAAVRFSDADTVVWLESSIAASGQAVPPTPAGWLPARKSRNDSAVGPAARPSSHAAVSNVL